MLRSSGHNRRRASAGFTLLEVMVSTLIFGTVSVAVMGAFAFLGTNLTRLLHAQQLEQNSRRAFYLFNQDVGMATAVTTAADDTLILTVPVNPATDPVTYTTVAYAYRYGADSSVPTQWVLRRQKPYDATHPDLDESSASALAAGRTPAETMLKNLTAFDFNYFNKAGTQVTLNVKGVQFSFTASRGTEINNVAGTSIYNTAARFQTVSPIVYLRNTATNSLLPP